LTTTAAAFVAVVILSMQKYLLKLFFAQLLIVELALYLQYFAIKCIFGILVEKNEDFSLTALDNLNNRF